MDNLLLKFLESCRSAEIIPRFLAFRIANNGCFDNKSVHDFQKNYDNDEFFRLSKEQQRPLFDINNTVICYDLT